ncbi:MAG TPA: DUF6152 family protein [Steroidobacteraceae bacterium]|nr:DUF6152 family protein [Steroidobacteraceae bacterium]
MSLRVLRSTFLLLALAFPAGPSLAHHSFGEFQMNVPAAWSGTLTKMHFINPHSYMEIDAIGKDGRKLHLRCEMRAATLLKRSGWSKEMFKVGSHVEIDGHPHRLDPNACYIENFKLGDAPKINRNDQFQTSAVDTSKRPLRLPDGQPNISGDWAVEQLVLTVPPSGGNGSMIPKSLSKDFAAGRITLQQVQATQPPRPTVVYTPEGKKAADAFNSRSPRDNPWFACKPTSIIRDWTADWPINRFTQKTLPNGQKVIDITYGLYNFERRIYVGMARHPDRLRPTPAGHSIGRWEGNTLVVDTVGFAAGVLSPPTRSSEQLHVVERFTFDPQRFSLRRDYSVTDPVYLAAPYESYDVMYLSDVPFQKQPCRDMTPEFQQ